MSNLYAQLSILFMSWQGKKAMVADLWVDSNCDFKFGRDFNDWEVETVQSFLKILGQKVIIPLAKDKIL